MNKKTPLDFESISKALMLIYELSEHVKLKESCISEDRTHYLVKTDLRNEKELNEELAKVLGIEDDLVNGCYNIPYPVNNDKEIEEAFLFFHWQEIQEILQFKLKDNLTELIRKA